MLSSIKRRFLKSINYSFSVSRNGKKLFVPVIHDVGRANLDKHEEHISALLNRLYRDGILLVDIGVNIGQTLIKFALIAGKECRYIGFEPNIKAATYVDEIIARNDLKNAMVVPVGLGSSKRLATLLMASAGSTDPAASINTNVRDDSFYGARKTIPLSDADTAFEELGIKKGPIIIKIDVEGAEFEVIGGMRRKLAELRPLVILEILPATGFSDGVNTYREEQAARLVAEMQSLGFTMYAIGTKGEIGHGIPSNDYLFVPTEQIGDVLTEA